MPRGSAVLSRPISRSQRDAPCAQARRAIAAWSHIEVNAFYAALHAALRESVPGDLADRLLAPFSWPDAQVLKDTVEAAGFHEIRVRSAALPLIFEGGIAQAARALEATPLAPALATLPAGTHLKLNAALGAHLAPLLDDGKVGANMTSNIAIARTEGRVENFLLRCMSPQMALSGHPNALIRYPLLEQSGYDAGLMRCLLLTQSGHWDVQQIRRQ